MKVFQGSCRRLAQVRFEFGKGLFNRIEVGTIRRQVADAHPASGEQRGDTLNFVGGEVIEDERVTFAQLRTEHVLEINREDLGIDRTFDQKGSGDAFMAQSRDKGGTLPVTVRQSTGATLAHRAAPVTASQLGVQPCLIDKHQLTDIPGWLLSAPKPAGGFNVRSILLGGARRFFYSLAPVVSAGATRR